MSGEFNNMLHRFSWILIYLYCVARKLLSCLLLPIPDSICSIQKNLCIYYEPSVIYRNQCTHESNDNMVLISVCVFLHSAVKCVMCRMCGKGLMSLLEQQMYTLLNLLSVRYQNYCLADMYLILQAPEFLKQSSVIYVILLRNEKLGNDNTANFVMIFIYSLPVQSTKICLRRIGWCPHKPVRKQNVCG